MIFIDQELILRAIELKDANLLREMINDPEIENMVVGWSLPVSERKQTEWIDNLNSDDDIKLIIEVNDVAVGMASISNLDYKNSTSNLNIKISNSYRGKGIGTRTIKLLVNYCFNELNLNCLTANILEYNKISQKLFKECGFIKDGSLRSRVYKKGCYHNLLVYSLLRSEYYNE